MNDKFNQLYNYLKSNGMTDLDAQSFYDTYRTDSSKLNKLYGYLKSNGMTDLDPNSFRDSYFGANQSKQNWRISKEQGAGSLDYRKSDFRTYDIVEETQKGMTKEERKKTGFDYTPEQIAAGKKAVAMEEAPVIEYSDLKLRRGKDGVFYKVEGNNWYEVAFPKDMSKNIINESVVSLEGSDLYKINDPKKVESLNIEFGEKVKLPNAGFDTDQKLIKTGIDTKIPSALNKQIQPEEELYDVFGGWDNNTRGLRFRKNDRTNTWEQYKPGVDSEWSVVTETMAKELNKRHGGNYGSVPKQAKNLTDQEILNKTYGQEGGSGVLKRELLPDGEVTFGLPKSVENSSWFKTLYPQTMMGQAVNAEEARRRGVKSFEENVQRYVTNSNIANLEEEEAVKMLTNQFGRFGFEFIESGAGDEMIVRTKDGSREILINLDTEDPSQNLRLQDFLIVNQDPSSYEPGNQKYAELINRDRRLIYSNNGGNKIQLYKDLKELFNDEDYKIWSQNLPYGELEQEVNQRIGEYRSLMIGANREQVFKDMETFKKSPMYQQYQKQKKEAFELERMKMQSLYDEVKLDPGPNSRARQKVRMFLSDKYLDKTRTEYNAMLNDINQSAKFLKTRYDEYNAELQKLNTSNLTPEQIRVKKEQLDKMALQLDVDRSNLVRRQRAVTTEAKQLEYLTGKYIVDVAKEGTFIGGVMNSFSDGISKLIKTGDIIGRNKAESDASGDVDYLTEDEKRYYKTKGYSLEEIEIAMANKAWKESKENFSNRMKSAIGDLATTKQYQQSEDRGIVSKALFGLAESLPAMATSVINPYVGFGSLSAQAYSSLEDEMLNDPDFETTPLTEMNLIALPYAMGMGALEKIGLSAAMSKNPIAKSLIMKSIQGAVKKTVGKGSAELLQNVLDKEIKSNMAKFGLRIVGGALTEAETGATQSLVLDIGYKSLINEIKKDDRLSSELTGGEFFDTPDTFMDGLKMVIEDGIAEGIGGMVMSGAGAISQKVINGNISLYDNEDVDFLKTVSTDNELRKMIVIKLKSDMLTGKITKAEAQNQLNALDKVGAIFNAMPDNLSVEDQVKSVNLMAEKQRLEKEIDGKDQSLVAAQKERITEIDNELQKISKDAFQKQATGEVPVQPEARVGEEVEGREPETKLEEVTKKGKEVTIDKPIIATNTTAELDRVKSVDMETEDGATFNIDGTKYEGGGLVVPIVSENTTVEEITPEMISDFVEKHSSKIGDQNTVKVGIYKFPNSNKVSIDLNIVAPESSRQQAIEFAKAADQESLFDLSTFENVKTGGTGVNPTQFTDEQFKEIAKALNEGRTPSFAAPTQQNLVTLENVEEVADKRTATATKLVLNALPDVKIYIHKTNEEYSAAIGEEAESGDRGAYDTQEGAIHINLAAGGNAQTVFHEAIHHALLKKGMDSGAILDLANGLNRIITDKKLKKRLSDFISQYETSDQAEEYLSELGAIMAEAEIELTTTKFNQFKALIARIFQKLGLPKSMVPFLNALNSENAVDFINSLTKSLRTGENIMTDGFQSTINPTNKIKKQVEVKEGYKLSYVKQSDIIDIQSLISDIASNDQNVWFWVADQLGRGFVEDDVIDGKHYLDAGPSFALDPKNRERGIIWASGANPRTLQNNINKSDYIFIISGSPQKSKLFNKTVSNLVRSRIEKSVDFDTFKKSLIEANAPKDITSILEKYNSYDDLFNGPDRKAFLIAIGNQANKKATKSKQLLESYNAFVDYDSLRDDFYRENGFEMGDIMLVLKPTGVGEKSDHSTYENNILGEVVGVPDSIINSYDILPEETRNKYKEDISRVQQQQVVAPYGMGVSKVKKHKGEKITAPVAGNKLFNEPLKDAENIARSYMQSIGMEYIPVEKITKLDEDLSKRISDAYDQMENNPNDPKVKAAYEAMAKETLDQYDAIVKEGYNVEINNNEPYSNSEAMIKDLKDNKRMKIFSTESGFGDEPITEEQRSENLLLKDSGRKDLNGETLLINDVFRFVHDFFGHAKLGNSFGPVGEENAWRVHSEMYSPEARKAMTSETRGQNSWVNFSGVNDAAFKKRDKARELRKEGKIEEADRLVGEVYEEMKFADQKVGILPDFAIEDGTRFKKQKDNLKGKGLSDESIKTINENYTDKKAFDFYDFDWNKESERNNFKEWLNNFESNQFDKNLSKVINLVKQDIDLLTEREIIKEKLKVFEELIIPSISSDVLTKPLSIFEASILMDPNATLESIEKGFLEAKNIFDKDGNIDKSKITESQIFKGGEINLPAFEKFVEKNPEYKGVFDDWKKIFDRDTELMLKETNAFSYNINIEKLKNLYNNLNDISKKQFKKQKPNIELTTDKNANPGYEAALNAIGETEQQRELWRKNNKVDQKQKRNPIVEKAAKDYYDEKITQEEYLDIVSKNQPIKPFDKVPSLPTLEEITNSLDTNKVATGIVGLTKNIKEGEKVASRLDIPAYENYDTWVVSIHDGNKEGKSIAYGQTAVLKNVDFKTFPGPAIKMAMGIQNKSTIARMFGEWVNEDPESVYDRAKELINNSEWTQIGMNPFRYSWFYDKSDGMPIASAEEVIQVGALVLAKNAVKVSPSHPMFETKSSKGSKIKFQKPTSKQEAIQKAKDKYELYVEKRGNSHEQGVAAALGDLQKSDWFANADDTAREDAVREIKAFFGEKIKKAPSVAKILGKPKPETQTKTVDALRKEFFTAWNKASREAKADLNSKRKAIGAIIKSMVRSGKITTKQSAVITDRASSINLDNPVIVQRFLDYVAKVFADANYQEKLSNAFSARRAIRRLTKSNNQAEVIGMAKAFLNIDPSMVEDIDTYNEIADSIKNAMAPSVVRGEQVKFKQPANIADVNEYTMDEISRQEEIKKDQLLAEYDYLKDAGLISKDMTLNEIRKIIEDMKSTDTDINDDVKDFVERRLDMMLGIVESIIRTGVNPITGESIEISDKNKDILKAIMKMDLKELDTRSLIYLSESVDNFLNNGITSGLEANVKSYVGAMKVKALVEAGIKSVRIKTIASELAATEILSIPLLFEKIFRGTTIGTRVMSDMGLLDMVQGKNKAEFIYNKIMEEYTKQDFYTKDFMTHQNIIERGMLAYLMRNVNGDRSQIKAELNRRIDAILESIDQLKEGNKNENKLAEMYENAFSKLKVNSRDIDIIRANSSKQNRDGVDWWINQWKQHYSDLYDVSLSVYNTMLSSDSNYTPDKLKSMASRIQEDDIASSDSGFVSSLEYTDTKKAGVLMENVRKKPKNRYVDLNFDMNNANSLRNALVDINTAGAIRQVKGFMDSNNFDKLLGDEASLIRKRINSYVKRMKGKRMIPRSSYDIILKYFNSLAKAGTIRALGGIGSAIKQFSPIINTIINAGRYTSLTPSSSRWIDNLGMPISNRGIKAEANIDSVDRRISVLAKSPMGKIYDGIGKVGDLWLKALIQSPDSYVARSSFITYYLKGLRDQGLSTKIDWDSHEVNKKAAEYAQMMLDRQQNVSDPLLSGELFATEDAAKKMITKIVMPFTSFVWNQRARMINDMQILASKVSTKEDKIMAIRSLTALPAEVIIFNLLGAGIRKTIDAITNYLYGEDDDEEEVLFYIFGLKLTEDDVKELKIPIKNLMVDLFSPLPGITDEFLTSGLNELFEITPLIGDDETADLIKNENDIRVANGYKVMTEKEEAKFIEDQKKKRTFQLYENMEETGWERFIPGAPGVALKTYNDLKDAISLAVTGKYEHDNEGIKSVKYISEEDREKIAYGLFFQIPQALGLLPREAGQIPNKGIRNIKKRSYTENQITKMQEVEKLTNRPIGKIEKVLIDKNSDPKKIAMEMKMIDKLGGFDEKQEAEYAKLRRSISKPNIRFAQMIKGGMTAEDIIRRIAENKGIVKGRTGTTRQGTVRKGTVREGKIREGQ
jgi:hypothetical protein